MYIIIGIVLQIIGFYILYSTSSRAVFLKHKLNSYLYQHRKIAKVLGALMLLGSFILLMNCIGIGVGFFFALISLMTISGCIIIIIPLKKTS